LDKSSVGRFEVAANDPVALRRFYARLFECQIRTQDAGSQCVCHRAIRRRIDGAISNANRGGVRIVLAVEDVLENVCYAEELAVGSLSFHTRLRALDNE
jgi:hypothetical protein